ncbi:Os09g0238700, partial [Oryza sativa Japonica Group]
GCDTPHPHTPPPCGTVGCPFVADIHPIAGSRRASPEFSSDSCVSVVGGEQRYQRHLKHRGWQDSERRLRIRGPMGRSPSSLKRWRRMSVNCCWRCARQVSAAKEYRRSV